MAIVEEMLRETLAIIASWELAEPLIVQQAMTFTRTDGQRMRYIRATLSEYYLHIEGVVGESGPGFYVKFTRNPRNRHGHRDEIIGWDGLYNSKPHIHLDEDRVRQDGATFSWAEIAQWLIVHLGNSQRSH